MFRRASDLTNPVLFQHIATIGYLNTAKRGRYARIDELRYASMPSPSGQFDLRSQRRSPTALAASVTTSTAETQVVDEEFDQVPKNRDSHLTIENPEAFVDANYQRLHAWFRWLTGRRETAADLTQESFAAFWSSLSRVRVREPRVWLYRIARNQWRKWCRTAARPSERELLASAAARHDQDPHAGLVEAELAATVSRFVLQLPPHYRETVVLRYWSDLSHKQIAGVLGIPGPLARWRIHHACKLLRERMRQAECDGEVK